MSSQPGGGPAIPAAAAVSGLGSDDDSDTGADSGQEGVGGFFSADAGDQQSDDGVPVGSADAEQDRVRASEESEDSEDSAGSGD